MVSEKTAKTKRRGRPRKTEAEKAETQRRAQQRKRANSDAQGKKKREATIVTRKKDGVVTCPHCGETTSIQLAHSYFGGKKRYACWSEQCKAHGKTPGRPRFFVIMPDGKWCGEKKSANRFKAS